MRLSDREIEWLASIVRTHITPYLEEKGYVTDDEVRHILKKQVGRQVCSTRSITMIQDYMAAKH